MNKQKDLLFKRLGKEVRAWMKPLGPFFPFEDQFLQLYEEMGEVARIIMREKGVQSWRTNQRPKDIRATLADELNDVIFTVICIAEYAGVSLDHYGFEYMRIRSFRDLMNIEKPIKKTAKEGFSLIAFAASQAEGRYKANSHLVGGVKDATVYENRKKAVEIAKIHIGRRLADVVRGAIIVACVWDIDLDEAWQIGMLKRTKRDTKRHLDNLKINPPSLT